MATRNVPTTLSGSNWRSKLLPMVTTPSPLCEPPASHPASLTDSDSERRQLNRLHDLAAQVKSYPNDPPSERKMAAAVVPGFGIDLEPGTIDAPSNKRKRVSPAEYRGGGGDGVDVDEDDGGGGGDEVEVDNGDGGGDVMPSAAAVGKKEKKKLNKKKRKQQQLLNQQQHPPPTAAAAAAVPAAVIAAPAPAPTATAAAARVRFDPIPTAKSAVFATESMDVNRRADQVIHRICQVMDDSIVSGGDSSTILLINTPDAKKAGLLYRDRMTRKWSLYVVHSSYDPNHMFLKSIINTAFEAKGDSEYGYSLLWGSGAELNIRWGRNVPAVAETVKKTAAAAITATAVVAVAKPRGGGPKSVQ